ncbi:hypothetical protein [Cohnella hongkongensis]|uniref:Uncharacterized protein n=1 Tax=Cohnella hongkongensis TaxID=178337 RepID=A0ABV9FFK9_9BACL
MSKSLSPIPAASACGVAALAKKLSMTRREAAVAWTGQTSGRE